MTDVPYRQQAESASWFPGLAVLRSLLPAVLVVAALVLSVSLILRFQAYTAETPALVESTFGELAVWAADQSGSEAPESFLGGLAKAEAEQSGVPALDANVLLIRARDAMTAGTLLIALLAVLGLVALVLDTRWSRHALLAALLGMDALLFVVPVLPDDNTALLVIAGSFFLIVALATSPGRITRTLSFIVLLSIVLLMWEVAKAAAFSMDYDITVPTTGWQYDTYESLDDGLAALEDGQIQAVIADRSDVRDLVPSDDDPTDLESPVYPDLRYLSNLDTDQAILGVFPISPAFPGRLSVVVRSGDVGKISHVNDLHNLHIAAVVGEFADERYLSVEQDVVLLDLKILNDVNLPHLQSIAEALLQPARRNGPLLLVRILSDAALHTWGEAALGFAIGATLGFALGTIFAHSVPAERGLLPYVVASQTVPILAIAPMVVIWLGAGPASVAVISAYLTFFPVTINTLRGLRSPHPNALELMLSYAASRWEIMWKLRFPAALPYIFTALKVSATASVVGAIIGELPSSIRDGLGRAILDFSSDYSLISTPKLWAAILMAASIGIASFLIVSLVERAVLRGYVRES